jgi:virginiamycin B lyase
MAPHLPWDAAMKWRFVIALTLACNFGGLSNVHAADAARERSVDELTVIAEIARSGDFMAYGFDALWMMAGSTIVRVDGTTNAVGDIPVPDTTGRVRGLAIGEGAVWIPDAVWEQIFKFDPVENKIALVIPASFSGTEGSIGIGAGSVWVTTRGNKLSRFDAATGALQAVIPLPDGAGAPAAIFGVGFVFVTAFARDELYKIDPRTNTLVQTIALRSSPRFLTAGEGSIWILNQGDGTVQRVDPMSGKVLASIETGHPGRGGDITAGGGYIWVTLSDVPLVQIDPKTNVVAALYKGIGWGDAIRFGGGSLWISGHSIRRLTPPH